MRWRETLGEKETHMYKSGERVGRQQSEFPFEGPEQKRTTITCGDSISIPVQRSMVNGPGLPYWGEDGTAEAHG